jgi:23S rRNA (cytosine1962-C5)-methyltransferase
MSSEWPEYELIDFGEGRKLERFGEWVLDRPAPAAAGLRRAKPQAWKQATARFEGERAAAGEWAPASSRWTSSELELRVPLIGDNSFVVQLEALPSGQVGVFPEQLPNWRWLARTAQHSIQGGANPDLARSGLKVLNLFAYTGGSTLAALAAGAQVVHVDAAKSVVTRARQNAAASGLEDKPARWIVEDAVKFCRREVKRGNRYDAIILDPPTYGHGPKGEEWNIKRDLLPLLELCGELTERQPKFVLLTCHSPGIGPAELSAYLCEGIFGACGQPPKTGELYLETADGRRLPSGVYARWPG